MFICSIVLQYAGTLKTRLECGPGSYSRSDNHCCTYL